jgi:N-acetylneuraminate synthase/N,N'-diacetyllegionaminate synthase
MVRAAAKAGADAVKVQSFEASSFCTDAATYQGERQIDLFRRHELSAASISDIAKECRRLGVMFFGTPDSANRAEFLLTCGAPCLKVGSDDLVHLPLLRELARFGVPLILSTGMADAKEILDALDATTGAKVFLMHCVSEYPTPPERANLSRIFELMKIKLDCHVGYSDHTNWIDAAVGAVWLRACMVEKHFTLDRRAKGPDHSFSADPMEFALMVRKIRDAEKMMGWGLGQALDGAPSKAELKMRVLARRSVVAGKALDVGTKIEAGMLAFKRPGDGLPPSWADDIIGKHLTRAVAADEQLREGDWR